MTIMTTKTNTVPWAADLVTEIAFDQAKGFGKLLKMSRELCHASIEDFADYCGLERERLDAIERGNFSTSEERKALTESLAWFLKPEEVRAAL